MVLLMKKLLKLILILTLLIPFSAQTNDDIKKLEEEKLANEQGKKKNNESIVLKVNCWSKKDGYPDPERAKLYGKELYFIIDTKKNTVVRFYQKGQDEIKQTSFEIVEINEKKVVYQAQIFNPNQNRKVEVKYEFYYRGTKDHNGFGYPINRLKPDVRKPHIACSPEYHSIEVLTEIDNSQSYKDAFIEKRIKVEKNFEKELLGNCFSGGFTKGHQVLKNYLGYAFELISIYNFETDMSKNNINYCHTVQFKPKIYTKNPFDAKTSDARIEWGGGQSIQIDNFTYEDSKIVPLSVIDVDQSYNCLWMIFIDTKINGDNFISLYMELNDGRHILSSDDQSTLFLEKYCN